MSSPRWITWAAVAVALLGCRTPTDTRDPEGRAASGRAERAEPRRDGTAPADDDSGGTGEEVLSVLLYTSTDPVGANFADASHSGDVIAYADGICEADGLTAKHPCTRFIAVIDFADRPLTELGTRLSISDQAEVNAPLGLLTPHFSDLSDVEIDLPVSPSDLGFVGDEYWTGAPTVTSPDVGVSCGDWSTAVFPARGGVGNAYAKDYGWVGSRDAVCDEATLHLLCMCW